MTKERQESYSPNFASRVRVSSAIEIRTNNDEKHQGHIVFKEARLAPLSRITSLILFPYNPENSISLPPGILTRPIFRDGGVLKGWRVTNDGVEMYVYANSGLICPIKKDPVTTAERNGRYGRHRFENPPMVFANECDSSSPLSSSLTPFYSRPSLQTFFSRSLFRLRV